MRYTIDPVGTTGYGMGRNTGVTAPSTALCKHSRKQTLSGVTLIAQRLWSVFEEQQSIDIRV